MRRVATMAFVLASACGEDGNQLTASVFRDSAGIRIVENRDVGWERTAEWSLSAEAVLQIGALDAEPAYQLHRVIGAATLSDGRVVVANGGSQELRWYDAAGLHEGSAGGAGEGPGEFAGLMAIGLLPGDSIVAHDVRLRRLSVFDPAGRFVRSTSLVTEGHAGMAFAALAGTLTDGSLLMAGRVFPMDGAVEGPLLAPMPLYRYGTDGQLRDSVGTFHGWEATTIVRRTTEFVGMAMADRPFGRSTSVTPAGERIAIGTPFAFSFELFEPDGTLRAMVRLDRANDPVTANDIAAYKRTLLDNPRDPAGQQALQRQADESEYPDTKPAYAAGLKGDRAGNIWVPAHQIARDLATRWSVFDPDGRYLGDLTSPARFRVFEIGDDYVLGVWRDDLDVEYLRKYQLRKP